MEELKLMPDHLDVREVAFTNILILGFDVDAKECEHRIQFNRDMFSTPNKKGMEVVLHFLFTKLDRDVAKEVFRSCWFPHEKSQSQEFRKVCIEWLSKLKKQPDCAIPVASQTLLLSPTGNKFYQFLFHFSMYVLKKRMEAIPKKHGVAPSRPSISTVTKNYTHQMGKAQSVSTVNEMERLICFLSNTEAVKEKWKETSCDLSKEYKSLKKKKKECDIILTEIMEKCKLLFGKSNFSAKDVLKRTQDIQKVTEIWSTISKFHESQKKLKVEVEHGIINNENGYCLDGNNIDFKLPDLLVRECERQMHLGTQYENIYKEGKIDLTSLLRLWNLSLHLVKEALVQHPLPDVTKDSELVNVQVHNHSTMLKDTISLKHMLANELTDVHMSIETLKELLEEEQAVTDVFTPVVPQNFSFDILPCTPGLKFEPGGGDEGSESSQEIFSYDSQVVATPDAVRGILDTLESTVVADVGTPVNAGITMLLARNKMLPHEEESNKEESIKGEGQSDKEESKDNKGELRNIPKFGKKAKNMRKTIAFSKIPTLKGRNQKENIKPLVTSEASMAEAQRLLIDQITDSIVSTSPNVADNELPDYHALEKPFEAFNADIFMKHDKVMRTPEMRAPLESRNDTLVNNSNTSQVDSPLAKDIVTRDSCIETTKEPDDLLFTPFLSSNKKIGGGDSESSWWCNTPEFSGDCDLLTPTGAVGANTNNDTLTDVVDKLFLDDADDEL